jgi:hypothetical protein
MTNVFVCYLFSAQFLLSDICMSAKLKTASFEAVFLSLFLANLLLTDLRNQFKLIS